MGQAVMTFDEALKAIEGGFMVKADTMGDGQFVALVEGHNCRVFDKGDSCIFIASEQEKLCGWHPYAAPIRDKWGLPIA